MPDEIDDGFIRGLIPPFPESMVHVLTPDLAIILVEFIVVIRNFENRHGAGRADHRSDRASATR
jgi:hypothetical protein